MAALCTYVFCDRCDRVGKARSLHKSRLKWLARAKHSSLSQSFINYGNKKCFNIGPWTGKLEFRFQSLLKRDRSSVTYLRSWTNCRFAICLHQHQPSWILTFLRVQSSVVITRHFASALIHCLGTSCGLYYKCAIVIIYYCGYSGLFYETSVCSIPWSLNL
jgi:hypothetical protein